MMLTSSGEQTISYARRIVWQAFWSPVLDPLRKRLLFRAHHCGMKENDLLLGRFADHFIESLDPAQLARFEFLMEQSDIDILNWITGKETPPDDLDTDIIKMIKTINNL